MTLDRDPRTARGDPHGFVIVAFGPTAGKSIAEPEVPFGGQRIGGVGEASRSLVGRDYEVGVVPIVDHGARWMDHLAVDDVVGNRQQRPDEHLVTGLALLSPGIP